MESTCLLTQSAPEATTHTTSFKFNLRWAIVFYPLYTDSWLSLPLLYLEAGQSEAKFMHHLASAYGAGAEKEQQNSSIHYSSLSPGALRRIIYFQWHSI